jgi:hypothetical protein
VPARSSTAAAHLAQAEPDRLVVESLGGVDYADLNDQWQRARANLADRRIALQRATRTIRLRLAAPVGGRQGRVRGYASRAERFAKQARLQHLQAELAMVEGRLAAGRMSVCRGGRRLAKQRHALKDAKLTEAQWRARWRAERLFLTADGDAAYPLGNGTIVVHPEQRWCELKLPAPMVHLANRPGGHYRLACPVAFTHRGDEWAVQTTTGAVRYDIAHDWAKGRWYLAASWRLPVVQPPSLQELRRHRVLGWTSTLTTSTPGYWTQAVTPSTLLTPSPST